MTKDNNKDKKIRHFNSDKDVSEQKSELKDDKNNVKLTEKDLKKIQKEGLKKNNSDSFKAELKSDLKKEQNKPGWPRWAKVLVVCGIIGLGVGIPYGLHYYQANWSQQATGRNLSPEQQASFIRLVRKYVKANWRPKEVNKVIQKKYNNFSPANQYQLSYAMYRSQQNSALYYNSFMYFLQAECSYYNLDQFSDPLRVTAKQLGSNTIPASLKDIQENEEFVEYSGTDNFEVLPNFKWINDNYKTKDDFKSFLNYAQAENENPIFKDKKVNIKLAYQRLGKILFWVSKHQDSDFYGDAMSLAKFYYEAIFQLNTDFGLQKTGNNSYTLKPETYSELKKLASNKKGAFHKDLAEYVKSVGKNGTISSALSTSYQTIASSYFGDSVFNNMADAVGGSPKVSQKTPKTVYKSDSSSSNEALNDLQGSDKKSRSNATDSNSGKSTGKNNSDKSDKKIDNGENSYKSKDTDAYLNKEQKKWNKMSEAEKERLRENVQKQQDKIIKSQHNK